jgi:hypothetical protein
MCTCGVNGHRLPRAHAAEPIRAGRAGAPVRAHPPAVEVEHGLTTARLPQHAPDERTRPSSLRRGPSGPPCSHWALRVGRDLVLQPHAVEATVVFWTIYLPGPVKTKQNGDIMTCDKKVSASDN